MRTKLFLTLTLASFLTAAAASATEVEVKLVRFSGEVPKVERLVALVDSNAMGNVKTYSAVVNEAGEFSYKATTPEVYPRSFDTAGKPDAFDTRDVGVTFAGSVKSTGGTYKVELDFQSLERGDTVLSGPATIQPVFKTLKQTGRISLSLSRWKIFTLPQSDAKKGVVDPFLPTQEILLVRVKG